CFFFQAEDGIRDATVTGVQTCALPICLGLSGAGGGERHLQDSLGGQGRVVKLLGRIDLLAADVRDDVAGLEFGVRRGTLRLHVRSEERRVGKEGRGRWSAGDEETGRVG